jgi:phospholipase/carboxylesterase
MDAASERLSPDRVTMLAHDIGAAHAQPLRDARAALASAPPPPQLQAFAVQFNEAFGHVEQAFAHFTAVAGAPQRTSITDVLAALHHAARAQEGFYALRAALPPFVDFWQLPDTRAADPPARTADGSSPATGVLTVPASGHHEAIALYVPETYSGEQTWPLIIALHGARGNGRDFLWSWVRDAKSLGYVVAAPTAHGDTWGPDDDVGLLEVLSWVNAHYRIASHGVLLTGMSDGATYTLLHGLAHPEEYRALAPLCGVLHPANETLGNLQRARGMPIYLVHGEQDFLFPVQGARMARDALNAAGALVEYRELPELSHTYPRSENVRILQWFAALPPRLPPR